MSHATRRRDAWLRHPIGQRVLESERALLASALPDLFGYYLLQAGGWGRHSALCADSRIRHRFVLDSDIDGHDVDVVATLDDWPIASDSVDVVVLPHSLELTEHPHQSLREAHRVLIGDGHLVVLGFAPWSAWGLWRLLGSRRKMPWAGHFVPVGKLRDWLALLGFEIVRVSRHCNWLPLPLGRIGNALGRVLPAGAYMVVAQKRVYPLTPIRPRWSPKRAVAVGAT